MLRKTVWYDRFHCGRDDRAGCHHLARNPHAACLKFTGLGFGVLRAWGFKLKDRNAKL